MFAGVQASTPKYFIRGKGQPTKSKYGIQAGVNMKIPFENELYFSPAIYYSQKGFKVTFNEPARPPDSSALNNDVTVRTVDVVPLFNIDFSFNPSRLFIKFGPSFEYAVSGIEKFEKINGQRVDRKMTFSYNDYNRMTVSAIVHLGFETANGFIIFGHYAHGLISMNNADFGPKIKQRIVGLSIGKYFRKQTNVVQVKE
ncbi:MAG: PorT family protein [Chitinophagaceae bacterium]|nr:PorT family protein [Chitinophagaceae bacterium]